MRRSGCRRIGCGAVLGFWLGIGLVNHAVAEIAGPSPPEAGQPGVEAGGSPPLPVSWGVQTVLIPGAPTHIRAGETLDQIVIETASGAQYFLTDCGEGLCAEAIANPQAPAPLPVGALPGSEVATGRHSIARAWLAEPTLRLLGATLGGPVAGALVIEDITARTFRMDLPTSDAFEDRRPRIVDLGTDHPDTVLVVRSTEATGARLAAIGLTGEGLLATIAQTEPLGSPGAWLNPIGAGDFAGSGAIDVAIVKDPDNEGILQILDFDGVAFHQRLSLRNVSNHVAGSDIIDMAVIADFDADGAADIAVPDAARTHIRILTFRNGQVAEPASIALPAPVVTEIASVSAGPGKRPYLLMGLADGQLVLLH